MTASVVFVTVLFTVAANAQDGYNRAITRTLGPLLSRTMLPSARSLQYENDYDDVALRSNFDAIPVFEEEKFPTEVRKVLRAQPIREVEEFTGPIHQWPGWGQAVVPVINYLGPLGDYCHCKVIGGCGCCLGFQLTPLNIKNNICLNGTISADPKSNSLYMLHTKLYYDVWKLMDFTISENEPPTLCLNIVPPVQAAQACIQLNGGYLERPDKLGCTCIKVTVHWGGNTTPIMTLPRMCGCLGHPIAPSRKQGILRQIIQMPMDLIKNALPLLAG